ncbi:MAG TPA: thiamine phosphate synthase [Burkholderiales bacterium]|nr:thiamine phosphate synthase [Burkholderiales bacterium]
MGPVKLGGLYAITPDAADTDWLFRQVEAVLRGGARTLQYRNKSRDADLRLIQGRGLLALCRRYGAVFIVNDDVELTQVLGADGVHLGGDDASIASARAILGPRLVGASCYDSLARALHAQREGADYVAFGSFFPSLTKPYAVRAPIELLQAARTQLDLPIVAIGGITLSNAATLIDAGADAVAVVSALFEAPEAGAAARAFSRRFDAQQIQPRFASHV